MRARRLNSDNSEAERCQLRDRSLSPATPANITREYNDAHRIGEQAVGVQATKLRHCKAIRGPWTAHGGARPPDAVGPSARQARHDPSRALVSSMRPRARRQELFFEAA